VSKGPTVDDLCCCGHTRGYHWIDRSLGTEQTKCMEMAGDMLCSCIEFRLVPEDVLKDLEEEE